MVIRNAIRLGAPALVATLLAQTALAADSPVNGRALFNSNPIAPCTNCHVDVQNRRDSVDRGGDLDFDLVYAVFLNAIVANPTQMGGFNALTVQDKRDIAAYIADVPKVRPARVDFTASTADTETAPVTLTFGNAVTATSALTINTRAISGTDAANFQIKSNGTTCAATSMTLAPGQTCLVNVTFTSPAAGTKTALLSVNYTQDGVMMARTAQLSGTVSGQGGGSSANTSGGGALPLGGLGVLALAGFLRRRPGRRVTTDA